ncbi:MAG: histidine phosphatase family protein [Lachnospiraceae bacterium]|nr:histidine phosphatase family protein [Lachnospiraceae bacterium]
MELYIARHGQTDWNAEGRTQGSTDTDLNDTGREDAVRLGESIKDIQFDAVYASPIKRAYNTAVIALEGRGYDIIKDKRIVEMSYGIFEGQMLTQIMDPSVNSEQGTYIIAPEKYIAPEGGESFDDVDKRVGSFLSDLSKNHPEDAKILIVAHGAVNMCMLRHLRKAPVADIWVNGIQSNGEVIKVVMDKNGELEKIERAEKEILITFAVPCYNSEKYMKKCLDSILPAGTEAEILIVNDGSKDGTADIADQYAFRFSGNVRAIHQENKGHGGAVNTGIQNARGRYFKVVDSDDWLDAESLSKLMTLLRRFKREEADVDMIITNYVYEHALDDVPTSHTISYTNCIPQDEIISWDRTGRFGQSQNLLMHSICYRTDVLRESGLVLPEHTFYVDNLYAYVPLPFVKKFYYLNVDLYRYLIGREDQSVNEKIMIGRIDQQILVNRLMVEAYSLPKDVEDKKCADYMLSYLSMISLVTSALLTISKKKENIEKRDAFFKWFKETDPDMYKAMKKKAKGRSAVLRGPVGNFAIRVGYKISQKLFKFN